MIFYFPQKAEINPPEIHSDVKFGLETAFFFSNLFVGLNVTRWRMFLPLLPALLVVKLELNPPKKAFVGDKESSR